MKLFKTGIVLIIISWLACLNPYWLIFAGPVFVVGLIVVWFSRAKTKTKLLTTILPLLLWYPGMYAFFILASRRMTPETFLIPKDFRGRITLIYSEPCGQTVPKVDGRLIYKVPDNGIMILTNEFETGIIDHEYYFVDENGNKVGKITPLNQHDFNEEYTLEKNMNEPPRNKVGIFHLGTSGGSTLNNGDYKSHVMAVNSWDSLRVQNSSGFVDSFVDSILFDCRQKK
jgi:hypothetical protein